ncbi:uncharacterized protein LOC123205033 isoform X2 [Mangifera indica]|uniref:uncharacterized protein LOC123205033 isoform X2 n=1 Tax=Mangifera indica TaxID=29780 RepID=UPI001CF9F739|nr:uncharacterized protein LOC123205033 isoform X2 [Mangifera indica]
MAEAAVNAVIEVRKCLIGLIGRQFMYLYNYKTNFDNLEKKAARLKDARDEVKAKVVDAENNVKKIKQTVKNWQRHVDSILEETDKLIQEKSNGSCFNLITCYKNGRKAWKTLNAITELLQEEKTFGEVSLPTTYEVVRLTNKDYEEFESRRSVFNDVLKELDDPEVGIIGVYGMGGIGKTTLVKEVGHQAKKNQKLDDVVFVEVSDKPDTKKIQDEIATQLRVKLDTEAERVSKLNARLKNGKKVLVILDNIWERLDLEALGIPCGDDRGGCKLLLTARYRNVLWSMDCKKDFSMGVLKEEEAWRLFKKMAGDVVDQTNELNSLPNDVCNECHGLPIVITTIARALRNMRHQFQWKDALRELRKPSPTKFAGLLEKEYTKIALSYNCLRRDELKKTLLICGLMVNYTTISDLFKLIFGLNILEGSNFTMEEARNKLESLVCELKDSCLLLDGSTSKQFAMHDVIRSVVITIAYKDYHVFTERNDMVMESSDKEQLKKCTKISLVDCNMIGEIWSQGLDYPKLEFFSTEMKGSFEIPEDFFVGMGNLKVLSFLDLKVLSLPTSLAFLVNLQTLCLDYGKFSDVTIIGELRKLKILSLRCCNIKLLPGEIGNLTQLQFLDLSYCEQLEVIVPNVISSLLRLEELYVGGCSILSKAGILKELKGLSKLTTLEIEISDDQILQEDFFSKKFERYNISIGNRAASFGGSYISRDDWKFMWLIEHADLRMLRLNLNSFIWHEKLQLLSNVELLCLDKLQGMKNDLSELDKKGFSELKYLCVQNNPNIVCIVDSTKCISHQVFPILESLIVFKLINLEKICYGPPSTESFYHLKFIEVKSCDKLENIFSFSNASRSLSQLQLIKVEDCKNLAEIFAVESKNRASKNEVIDKIEFCQLRFLKLLELPRIASFYSNINSEDAASDTIIPFFDKKVVFQSLEALELKAINFEKIWDDKLPITSCCYQNLERLIVDGCQKLKFVFPSSIIESFKQLQHLEISCCKELKEIVAKEETNDTTTFIFPRVVFLKLRELPELTTFYHGKHNSNWPMLKELEVHGYGRLDIFTSKYKVVVPNLEVLKLCSSNCEILWDSQLGTTSSCYQNLTSLILNGCGKLQYVFLSSMVKCFERLEHIEICNCSVLKEIISKGVEANKTFVFPRVTFLKLENLPELATFYPGVHTSEWPVLKELEVCNCDKIKIFTSEYMSFHDNNEGQNDIREKQSLFLAEKINPNLGKLTLSRADDMIKFLHQFPENFCRCTIEIEQDKSANISVGIFQRPVKLEKLILSDCSYEEIFTCGEDEKHTNILIQIKSLELRDLSDAKYLWGKGSKLDSLLQNLEVLEVRCCDKMINVLPSSASFENLTVLNVDSCYGLMNLLTPSTAKNLVQLREMKIGSCRMMTEIVSNKTEDVAAEDEIVFGKLKLLSLHRLQNLICFYLGNYALKFPSLEELTVDDCPMMMTFSVGNLNTPSLQKVQQDWWDKGKWCWEGDLNATIQHLHEEEINPNLGKLTLSRADDMIKFLHQFPENFCRCTIKIEQDKSANISVGIFQRPVKLKKLILSDCSYEEIFTCGEDEKHTNILIQIKSLELRDLSDAKYLWGKGSKLDSLLQNLEVLEVRCCDRMINVLPSSASFENLTVLNVDSCYGLMNLLTPSIAKNLVQLREMKIGSCRMMTEIVSNKTEDVAAEDEIVFSNLKLLSLENLRNLICFYYGNYSLKFPYLEELTVDGCPMMMTFSVGNLNTPCLQKVQRNWSAENILDCESDLNAIIQRRHEEEINPNLGKLTLSRADDMIKFLHQFPENFCRCTIEIEQDKSANISVGIFQRPVKLEKLILSDCSYEEIFTCGEDEKHTNILIQIKSLELRDLSDAKYLWGKGSKLDSLLQNLEVLEVRCCDRMINVLPSSASFENLTVLNVDSCYGLMNLLTPSTAKNLVQLREMKIGSCRMMTEIVSNKTEDVAAEDELVFGKLKLLSLEELKSLTCFCSGSYALKFPYLEELAVDGCPRMKTFFAGNLYTPSLHKVLEDWRDKDKWSWNGNLNATIQQLYEKEGNSKSEKLILSGKDVTLIWQEQFSEHQFSKVKILKIIKDESSNIPIGILQRFNNLKKLVLRSSSYKEIFLCEKDEKDVSMLTQIKELKLWGLFNLEYMWKEKSHLDSILQNLEMLHVNFCHNLFSIMPSSATFENLITLEVWYCDGLINLVSSSTAKSLVRLEELRLLECKMMAEVVSSEGGTKAEEIVFDKLKLLSLRNLKNLTSFSSGNYVLKFPALEEFIVEECHNMKTFFEGVLSVPSLRKVKKWADKLGYWEGDLNTTIQFLHRKK